MLLAPLGSTTRSQGAKPLAAEGCKEFLRPSGAPEEGSTSQLSQAPTTSPAATCPSSVGSNAGSRQSMSTRLLLTLPLAAAMSSGACFLNSQMNHKGLRIFFFPLSSPRKSGACLPRGSQVPLLRQDYALELSRIMNCCLPPLEK